MRQKLKEWGEKTHAGKNMSILNYESMIVCGLHHFFKNFKF